MAEINGSLVKFRLKAMLASGVVLVLFFGSWLTTSEGYRTILAAASWVLSMTSSLRVRPVSVALSFRYRSVGSR